MGCGASKYDENNPANGNTVSIPDGSMIMEAIQDNIQTPMVHLFKNITDDINTNLGTGLRSTFGLGLGLGLGLGSSRPGVEEIVDFSSKFHYVMVFPYIDGKQSATCKVACSLFLDRGFEIFTYLSVQKDELYCLITCNEDILLRFAQLIEFELELDPVYARVMMENGDPEKHIAPCNIPHVPDICPIHPYERMYIYIYIYYTTYYLQSILFHSITLYYSFYRYICQA